MGLYHASTIVKGAQRHGLKIRRIDVTRSHWLCMLEVARGEVCVRLGMRYVKGLREEAAEAMVRERARRPFASIEDFTRRVPVLNKAEAVMLAEIGALNFVGTPQNAGGADGRRPRSLPQDVAG